MGIPRRQKPSPAAGELLFQLDPEPLEECVTAYGGIPLVLQAVRSLDCCDVPTSGWPTKPDVTPVAA